MERLDVMLAELTDVESELEGIIYILDLMEEIFEYKNQSNERNGIHVLAGQMKYIRTELMKVMNKLDKYTLGID